MALRGSAVFSLRCEFLPKWLILFILYSIFSRNLVKCSLKKWSQKLLRRFYGYLIRYWKVCVDWLWRRIATGCEVSKHVRKIRYKIWQTCFPGSSYFEEIIFLREGHFYIVWNGRAEERAVYSRVITTYLWLGKALILKYNDCETGQNLVCDPEEPGKIRKERFIILLYMYEL